MDTEEKTADTEMPTERSMELAAQAWQHPTTERLVMDVDLATAFARIMDAELQRVRGERKNWEETAKMSNRREL